MAWICLKTGNYAVLNDYNYSDETQMAGANWYIYENAIAAASGSDPIDIMRFTWKGSDYELTSYTEEQAIEYFHDTLKDSSSCPLERYDGTTTALAQKEYVKNVIKEAIEFGMKVIEDFSAENVMLGITADGMTNSVRKATKEIVDAIYTGSLYDAIAEAKSIPLEDKDEKYITDARLLVFVNKLEEYLGVELSETL